MLDESKKIICCSLVAWRISFLQAHMPGEILLWDLKGYLDAFAQLWGKMSKGKREKSLALLDRTAAALASIGAASRLVDGVPVLETLCGEWSALLLPSPDPGAS